VTATTPAESTAAAEPLTAAQPAHKKSQHTRARSKSAAAAPTQRPSGAKPVVVATRWHERTLWRGTAAKTGSRATPHRHTGEGGPLGAPYERRLPKDDEDDEAYS